MLFVFNGGKPSVAKKQLRSDRCFRSSPPPRHLFQDFAASVSAVEALKGSLRSGDLGTKMTDSS